MHSLPKLMAVIAQPDRVGLHFDFVNEEDLMKVIEFMHEHIKFSGDCAMAEGNDGLVRTDGYNDLGLTAYQVVDKTTLYFYFTPNGVHKDLTIN